ncbi:MAG: hypothetical protein ACREL6_09680 [Gemmatimonadales bacterium]
MREEQVIDPHRIDADQHQVLEHPAAAIELQHDAVDHHGATGAAPEGIRQRRAGARDHQLHAVRAEIHLAERRQAGGRGGCGLRQARRNRVCEGGAEKQSEDVSPGK